MIRMALRRRMSGGVCSNDVWFTELNGVLSVHLNRDRALNALSLPMLQSIKAKVVDSKPSLVYLSGKGRAFCAGGDVKILL
jgi:enoyl-CoA hydratase/carnithine racemase